MSELNFSRPSSAALSDYWGRSDAHLKSRAWHSTPISTWGGARWCRKFLDVRTVLIIEFEFISIVPNRPSPQLTDFIEPIYPYIVMTTRVANNKKTCFENSPLFSPRQKHQHHVLTAPPAPGARLVRNCAKWSTRRWPTKYWCTSIASISECSRRAKSVMCARAEVTQQPQSISFLLSRHGNVEVCELGLSRSRHVPRVDNFGGDLRSRVDSHTSGAEG